MSVVRASEASSSRRPLSRALRVAAGPLLGLAVFLLPFDAAPQARAALSITSGTLAWWAADAFDPAWAGLAALALFALTGTSSVSTAASGFWNTTVGFLFGALAIGRMVSNAGLAKRLAYTFGARMGSSYTRLLLAFICVDFLLTFLVPSGIARVAVLAAIVAGMVDSLGIAPRTSAARGLMLSVTCAASLFDKMVLAGTSSILASGIIERVGGVRVTYGLWFVAYLPCVGLTIAGCWALVRWLHPDEDGVFAGASDYFAGKLANEPVPPHARHAALLVLLAVALWLTDGLHPLEPYQVAMAVAALACLPGLRLLGWRDLTALPYRTLVFTATALSISAVLSDTGALSLLTRALVEWMAPAIRGPVSATFVLYWSAFAYHLLLGAQNLMVTATLPPVVGLAQPLGYNPAVFGLIWLFGTAGKIFPYQSGVLMVGFAYGYFTRRDLLRLGFLLAVLECLILLLLVPLYWPLLGLQ